MAIGKAVYDFLPKYYQIEANNLKGLLPGFVVAQMKVKAGEDFLKPSANVLGVAASETETDSKMIANGHIVAISADGIKDPESTDKNLFIVYNDPILTLFPATKFYATNLDEEELRCVQLIPGDEWMTDMVYNLTNSSPLYGRIVEIASTTGQYNQDADWYGMTKLADGTTAKHYMFLG